MITDVAQRWNRGRTSYRPPDDERFEPSRYEVAPIVDRAVAKAFVLEHHYSKSFPAARLCYGLYERGGSLQGVAVFSHPVSDAVLAPLPGEGLEKTELGRLVLLDPVKKNGESWFCARVYELLRKEGLVSTLMFSDPEVRTDAGGREVFLGHVGCVYQATNAVYTGRGAKQKLYLLPDGNVLPARAISKVRNHERGGANVVQRLVGFGADAPVGEPDEAWLEGALAKTTRRQNHAGNHRYFNGLDRAAKKAIVKAQEKLHNGKLLPYPKMHLESLFHGEAA